MTDKIEAVLTGKESIDSLVKNLIASSPDFAEEHRQFEEAISFFRTALSKETSLSVDDLLDAIRRYIASQFIFAGYLGFHENIDHFLNPVARTFTEVDPEIYLRERVSRTLPEYVSAKAYIDIFRSLLSSEQQPVFENITIYISHLETIIPKIAHYEGFLLGNDLLRYVLPGYFPDSQLTARYSLLLKEYMH